MQMPWRGTPGAQRCACARGRRRSGRRRKDRALCQSTRVPSDGLDNGRNPLYTRAVPEGDEDLDAVASTPPRARRAGAAPRPSIGRGRGFAMYAAARGHGPDSGPFPHGRRSACGVGCGRSRIDGPGAARSWIRSSDSSRSVRLRIRHACWSGTGVSWRHGRSSGVDGAVGPRPANESVPFPALPAPSRLRHAIRLVVPRGQSKPMERTGRPQSGYGRV